MKPVLKRAGPFSSIPRSFIIEFGHIQQMAIMVRRDMTGGVKQLNLVSIYLVKSVPVMLFLKKDSITIYGIDKFSRLRFLMGFGEPGTYSSSIFWSQLLDSMPAT